MLLLLLAGNRKENHFLGGVPYVKPHPSNRPSISKFLDFIHFLGLDHLKRTYVSRLFVGQPTAGSEKTRKN